MHGRNYVIPEDVKSLALRVLRHRIIVGFEGAAEGVTSETIIHELLRVIPAP